jgi:molecular chaperone GrpE
MLENNHLDDNVSSEERPRGKGEDAEQADKDNPMSDKNMTEPIEVIVSDEDGVEKDGASKDDKAESETMKPKRAKAAKRTSRKELLELISNKNEILIEMESRLQDFEQELQKKEDKILRIAAEFENYKKRTRREWELLAEKAKAELITDILGVLDDFDRALEALGERDDHVADGVILIVKSLKDVLGRAGLKEVEALGQPFDPQFHEAIGETDDGDYEDGAVAHVAQKGYQLNDVLIRPARVIVSKKK